MSAQVSFSSIPPELFLSIVSYLPVKDIRNLSLTLKSFRVLAIHRLFRSVRLYPESIVAFQRGGSLGQLGGLVQHLTLDTANSGIGGYDAICTFTRACIEGTDLDSTFPNVTSLKIVFSPETNAPSATFDMDKRILGSTLLGFSRFSLYKKLKSLTLEIDFPGEGGINPTVEFDTDIASFYQMSNENWEFVILCMEGEEWLDPWGDSDDLFPTSLKELRVVTPPGKRYNIHFPDPIGFGIFGAAASSTAKSLEKLEVSAVPPIFFSNDYRRYSVFPEVVYSNVKDFSLEIDTEYYIPHLMEVVRKVPNVERFELIFSSSTGLHIPARREVLTRKFTELTRMSKLKTVIIEAPMRDEITNLHTTRSRRGTRNESHPADKLSIGVVIEAVTFWLNSGMDKLESVEFRLYSIPKNRLRDRFEMLELWGDVVREGTTWRLEWKSLKRNFENGRVVEGKFSSPPDFDRERCTSIHNLDSTKTESSIRHEYLLLTA
ncbi:uncharacterized protein DFL_007909 [Arthrobotrys flagrans]|uniref:F-box domain-containing protein n=1 Tax=Arthrobotrys flagrans TaxID=97331 RepID=A0A436ZXU0_ARTFL|nr:hypothetical protein DFL_007909 [Arthrobotrys flagrans]